MPARDTISDHLFAALAKVENHTGPDLVTVPGQITDPSQLAADVFSIKETVRQRALKKHEQDPKGYTMEDVERDVAKAGPPVVLQCMTHSVSGRVVSAYEGGFEFLPRGKKSSKVPVENKQVCLEPVPSSAEKGYPQTFVTKGRLLRRAN